MLKLIIILVLIGGISYAIRHAYHYYKLMREPDFIAQTRPHPQTPPPPKPRTQGGFLVDDHHHSKP